MHVNGCFNVMMQFDRYVDKASRLDWCRQFDLALVDLQVELILQSLGNLLRRNGAKDAAISTGFSTQLNYRIFAFQYFL